GGAFPDGSVWDQSSHGPTADGRTKPEVIARGSGTYAAASPEDHNGEGYREFDGTSVATPLVTGAAALLLQAHPGWTPMMVREALMLTADSAQMPDNDRGWGRIDVLAALAYGPSDVGEATPSIRPRLVVSPNPATGSALVDFRNIGGGPAHLELYAPSGRLLRRLSLASTSEPFTLDLGSGAHGLIPGVYLLRLHSAASEASTKLIVR
ncbi:MAG: S8 family peptidase, partial [Candidatus Eisenbacteria bacterium]|nr:S8 family peptidase [Candidatus Eisenbacteria bacterium]